MTDYTENTNPEPDYTCPGADETTNYTCPSTEATSYTVRPYRAWTKALADSIGISEVIGIVITSGKSLLDSLGVADVIGKMVGKVLSETMALADTTRKAVGKVFADSVSIADSIVVALGGYKLLTDTVAVADAVSKAVGKVFTDSVALADTAYRAVGKGLADTVAGADAMVRAVGKALSDTVTLTDALVKDDGKVLGDSVAIADSINVVLTPGAGADYVVTEAGTTACNGNYNEYSTSDGVASFKHETNEMYLFRVDGIPTKFWDIAATHGGAPVLYEAANGATPFIGTYTIITGDSPAAVVAAG